jgi:cytochrome c biogenesis protein CcmG/thiol:disulfide interchange protein DsbE
MDRISAVLANRKRWWLLFLSVIILGGGWVWVSAVPESSTTGGRIPSPREGFLAPEFSLEQLDGGQMSLADLRGKPVIVNLWASWCPPCRAEMPALENVYQTYRTQGLEILAVNMTSQDGASAAAAFTDEMGLSMPVLLDRTGQVGNLYLSRALPSTYFIDREGIIRRVVIGGPMSEVLLRSAVEELLEASP